MWMRMSITDLIQQLYRTCQYASLRNRADMDLHLGTVKREAVVLNEDLHFESCFRKMPLEMSEKYVERILDGGETTYVKVGYYLLFDGKALIGLSGMYLMMREENMSWRETG